MSGANSVRGTLLPQLNSHGFTGVVILPFHPAFNKGISFCKVKKYLIFVAFPASGVSFNKLSHTDKAKFLMVVFVSLTELFLCPKISACTNVSLKWDKHPVSCIAMKTC